MEPSLSRDGDPYHIIVRAKPADIPMEPSLSRDGDPRDKLSHKAKIPAQWSRPSAGTETPPRPTFWYFASIGTNGAVPQQGRRPPPVVWPRSPLPFCTMEPSLSRDGDPAVLDTGPGEDALQWSRPSAGTETPGNGEHTFDSGSIQWSRPSAGTETPIVDVQNVEGHNDPMEPSLSRDGDPCDVARL